MLFVTKIVYRDSYYQSDCQDLEDHPLDGKRKGYSGIFHEREYENLSEQVDFGGREKMLEKVFRSLVEEDEESEDEGEHIFCFSMKYIVEYLLVSLFFPFYYYVSNCY